MRYFIETEYNIYLGRNYNPQEYSMRIKDCEIYINPPPFSYLVEPSKHCFDFNLIIEVINLSNNEIEEQHVVLNYHDRSEELFIKEGIYDDDHLINHIYFQDGETDILGVIIEILEEKKKELK